MKVRVLFFSVLRDITGCHEAEICTSAEATVGDLIGLLLEQWERLAHWEQSLLVAVDQDYARPDTLLRDGCEVAIMPPVQGG